ncbi:MAG TPA: hypothetical protein VMU89_20750 [Thermomicrobiaceae bacterium]|nr:hypothetical protein [Thermomicrobiaceae bacterium]
MVPVIATVVESRRGDRRCWAGHVRMSGRPVLVLPVAPSRQAAASAVRRRWPEAEIVDLPTFARSRGVPVDRVPEPAIPVWREPEPRQWYTRWRRRRG